MRYYQSPIRTGRGSCEEGFSRCHDCGECKPDPEGFYDGLRCIECCEAEEEEPECEVCGEELLSVAEEMSGICDDCERKEGLKG
jgi:hypothetical protein